MPTRMAEQSDQPPERTRASRAAEHVFFGVGSGIASIVYGTVLVMATLTAGYATEKHPWTLAVIVATTSFVLWLSHLYAHGLAASIEVSRHLRRNELSSIFRRELGILLAAVAPTTALLLGGAGVFSETTAVWVALAIGLVTLAVEGLRFARLERLALTGTIAVMGLNLALGLAIVALKVAVAH
jgi:hypothetical protein